MPGGWTTSSRRSRLPHDWAMRRAAVCTRANGQCEYIDQDTKLRCLFQGSECDHVIHGDNHDLDNLQWLCTDHHAAKSSSEGNQAKRERRQRLMRRTEKHPGILD